MKYKVRAGLCETVGLIIRLKCHCVCFVLGFFWPEENYTNGMLAYHYHPRGWRSFRKLMTEMWYIEYFTKYLQPIPT